MSSEPVAPSVSSPTEPQASGPATASSAGGQAEFSYPTEGRVIAGRFQILEDIGRQNGGRVYRARDREDGEVRALWLLPPEIRAQVDVEAMRAEIRRLRGVDHKNLVEVFDALDVEGGGLVCSMEFVSGQRLSELIEKKRRTAGSGKFSLKGAYNLVAHLLAALGKVHPESYHGVISPRAVLVDGRGRVRLLGLGILRHLPRDEAEKIVRHGPPEGYLGPPGDVYSLSALFAELATGGRSLSAIDELPRSLVSVLRKALHPDVGQRFADADATRQALSTALKKLKAAKKASELKKSSETKKAATAKKPKGPRTPPPVVPSTPPPGSGATPPPAPSKPNPIVARAKTKLIDDEAAKAARASKPAQRTSSLFERALGRLKAPPKQEAVWLAQRDGLDYGPFTLDELVDRVRHFEFDENTLVQDLSSQERRPLLEFEAFKQPLERLVRERAAKQQEKQAVRSGQLVVAKKAGKGLTLGILLGTLAVVSIISYLIWRAPEPKPLLYADVMPRLGRPITIPEIEPAAAVAKRVLTERAAAARKRARARAAAKLNYVPGSNRVLGDDGEFEGQVQRIDFGGAGSSGGRPLSDREVDRTIRVRWGNFTRCVTRELKRNPSLDRAVISFWVRGNGSTGGVKIQSNGTERFFRCLRSQVAALKFRAHGGPARKVTYPLSVSR